MDACSSSSHFEQQVSPYLSEASPPVEFSNLGLPVSFFELFISYCGGREKFIGLSTSQVCEIFLKPLTEQSKNSLCQQLICERWESDENDVIKQWSGLVRPAHWFVSHAWKYLFLDLVEALLSFFNNQQPHQLETIIWFDLFTNSQHNTEEKPFEWWVHTFRNAIGEIGNVVLVMAPWDNPIPLSRTWCVFEIFSCISAKANFQIAMTTSERQRFISGIKENSKLFYKMLSDVRSEHSDCFIPSDREKIFAAIKQAIGFIEMDSLVFRTMENWFITQLEEGMATAIDDIEKAEFTHSLAMLHQDRGMYVTAEKLARAAFESRQSFLGQNHPSTLSSQYEVGILCYYNDKWDESEQLYIDCLERRRAVLGNDNPVTLESLCTLAGLYMCQKNYNKAESLYLLCLEERKRVLGATHSDTLITMNNIACLYSRQDRDSEAFGMYTQCFEASNIVNGISHPYTLLFLSNLASSTSDPPKKEELLVLAYEERKRVLGSAHPQTMSSCDDLASFLSLKNDVASIVQFEVLNLEIIDTFKRLGQHVVNVDTHYIISNSIDRLAKRYQSQNRLSEANSLFTSAIELLSTFSNLSTPLHFDIFYDFGLYCYDNERYDEAIPLLTQAMKCRGKPNSIKSINIRAFLARCHFIVQRYQLAEKHYRKCWEKMKQLNKQHDPLALQWLCDLASSLKFQADKKTEALSLYHQILDLATCNPERYIELVSRVHRSLEDLGEDAGKLRKE